MIFYRERNCKCADCLRNTVNHIHPVYSRVSPDGCYILDSGFIKDYRPPSIQYVINHIFGKNINISHKSVDKIQEKCSLCHTIINYITKCHKCKHSFCKSCIVELRNGKHQCRFCYTKMMETHFNF